MLFSYNLVRVLQQIASHAQGHPFGRSLALLNYSCYKLIVITCHAQGQGYILSVGL